MIDILLAVAVWYGLGAIAAIWAGRKGHAPDLWTIGAALWGALMVPLAVAARIAVHTRPAQPAIPTRDTSDGGHMLLVVRGEDSPREALAPLAGRAMQISKLDIIVLVSEEARSGILASTEMANAEELVHRILRNLPAIETSTVITSLSALDQLVDRGWHADVVATSDQILTSPPRRAVASAIAKLDRHHGLPVPRPTGASRQDANHDARQSTNPLQSETVQSETVQSETVQSENVRSESVGAA